MKLSPNFTLEEFCYSYEAERRGIDNSLPIELYPAVKHLLATTIEPLRRWTGPLKCSSGHRCQELERALKRRPKSWTSRSQHTKGEAMDTKSEVHSPLELADIVLRNGIPFDQMILEYYDPDNPRKGWLHLSMSFYTPPRGEILTFDGDAYVPGLQVPS